MKNLFLLLMMAVIAGCTDKVIEKPENLISEDQMVDIYFDVALFNAAKNSGYDKFSEHSINSQKYLFEKYGVDSLQLAKSSNYYAAKPVVYERIYKKVEDRLDTLKVAFDKEIKSGADDPVKEAVKADSLRSARELEEELQEVADTVQ